MPASYPPLIKPFLDRPPRLLIDGGWVMDHHEHTFPSNDPGNKEFLANIVQANASDVDRVVQAARKTFRQTVSHLSGGEIGALLHRLAMLLERDLDTLAQIESLDNGKPLRNARMDVQSAVQHLRYYAGWADKLEGASIPVQDPSVLVVTRREPLGVVGLIVPWNFPLLMAIWKLAPALACGNCCILKPAESTSLSALYLGDLIIEAGFPNGMVQILTGDGRTGALLSEHLDVNKVGFTGSTAVGRKIMAASAGSNLKRVSLELGGKSPNIIFRDAPMEQVEANLVWSSYYNSGQECTLGSRIFVQKQVAEPIMDALAKQAKTLTIGYGMNNPDLGPLIHQGQLDRVSSYVEQGKGKAELVFGGEAAEVANYDGFYFKPTLFYTQDLTLPLVQEEIFGPVVTISVFEEVEEVINLANATRYGLAAGVWTKDLSKAMLVARRLESGVVWINGYDLFHPAVPFGGYKESGIGREMGKSALELYTQEKAIWIKT